MKQKISPFLWFDSQAEKAALRSRSSACSRMREDRQVTRYGEGGPCRRARCMTATFELDGQEFMALNGGPQFKFTEAVSLVVNCEDQKEVDHYWDKLTAGGGEEGQCGWLKDKYGLSWQIVPTILAELLSDPDPTKAGA